jgi:asparagine synthase (glutamine-hydrolysing)
MCGISGIINFKKKPDIDIAKKMNSKISYRGPDFKSTWSNSFSVIGFVRLAIIDLSTNSNQPFISQDKKISIIYNGEIYNFKELKNKYFNDKVFKSRGDGEIILHLYQKFGIEFIQKIKGMFSIFISDENKKISFLIRDRFGIKPLYYYHDPKKNELTFCSEIPGLFENPSIKKEQNYFETYRYLKHGLVSATEETWFKNIYQVKQSHYIKFDSHGLKEIQYYKLEDMVDEKKDEQKSFYFYQELFKNKILETFRQHTIFDVAAGIHQSGGLDSTALVAITKMLDLKFDTYTFDYEHKNFSEVTNAKKLSKSAGLNNYTSLLKDENLEDYLNKVVQIQYEPFSSLRVVSNHHLYDQFQSKKKVILDGTGGDEIFGGYHYHAVAWHLDMLKESNSNKTNKRYEAITRNHETLNHSIFREGALKRLNNSGVATEDGSEYYDNSFLNQDFLKKYSCETEIKKPFESHLCNAQYTDLFYHKIPRSLRYVDRASMRFGVEARVPLLDHEFVELCFNLPNKFKMGFGQQRLMMKYFIRNTLDKKLILQNKRTIADPQSFWLQNALKKLVLELLNSQDMKNSELFNYKEIKKFYEKFLKAKKHINSFFLFQIVNTLLWQKNILKKVK